jgi:galactose-1-phosphate uridylyltransferase
MNIKSGEWMLLSIDQKNNLIDSINEDSEHEKGMSDVVRQNFRRTAVKIWNDRGRKLYNDKDFILVLEDERYILCHTSLLTNQGSL